VVAATVSLIFFSQGAMFTLAVLLKPMAADLGWPREAPSLGYSAAFFGAGVGALYFGHLSERLGMARIAAFGSISVALGVYLTSLAREPWHIWLSYGVFIGLLGNACMFTPLVANVARWFERHRGIALGIATCGQSLGGMIWLPLLTWVNGVVGWRETFQVYATACLVVMLPLTLLLRRRPPTPVSARQGTAQQGGDLVLGLRPKVLTVTLSFAIVCCCVPMSIPLVHLPAHGSDLGFAPQAAAMLLAVALFASLASRVLGGALADRIGGLRTLFIGSAIQCTMLAVIAFTRDLWTLYAVCLLYGLGYGGIIAMYAYILREYFPPVGLARRMAVVYLFGTAGMAAGGWIGGRIFDAAGSYQQAFLTGVAVNLVNLVVIGSLILRARRVGALDRAAA
jgi:MFS family permease